MKKRLLAGLLSFTMLTGQMLPVVAADDADVTVSGDAVYVEEETDGVETVYVDGDFEIEDNIDFTKEYVVEDGEYTYVYNMEPIDSVAIAENGYASSEFPEDFVVEEGDLQNAAASHIRLEGAKSETIEAGVFEANGELYNISTSIIYNSMISYRGRKIKAYDDKKVGLNATVTNSGLYNLAASLSTSGTVNADIIKWKFTTKKNKDANSNSYFTVKASVSSKIAKQFGIKGKALKTLKKAVKQFNKTAKTNKLYFYINPVNLDYLWDYRDYYSFFKLTKSVYSGFRLISRTETVELRVRIDESQPVSITKYTVKKWSKPSKKEVSIVKEAGTNIYDITPLTGNYTGTPVRFRLNFF